MNDGNGDIAPDPSYDNTKDLRHSRTRLCLFVFSKIYSEE